MLVKMKVNGKFKMDLLTLIEINNICDSTKDEGHPISSFLHFNMMLEVEEVGFECS